MAGVWNMSEYSEAYEALAQVYCEYWHDYIRMARQENSLVIQWLELHAFTAEGIGSILFRELKKKRQQDSVFFGFRQYQHLQWGQWMWSFNTIKNLIQQPK